MQITNITNWLVPKGLHPGFHENPICHLATVENDQLRVRIIWFRFADETGFYFQTDLIKAMCNQLLNLLR